MADLGIPVPTIDAKIEGVHREPWILAEASDPILMAPDAFLDARVFDPEDVAGYLAGFGERRRLETRASAREA